MKKFKFFLTLGSFLIAFLGTNTFADNLANFNTPIYAVVRGAYNEAKLDQILSQNCISGITYYFGWSRVNPDKDKFDFSDLVLTINKVKSKGKKINLAVLPGRWSPKWIFDSNVKTMNWVHDDGYVEDGKSVLSKAPIPWDPVYLNNFFELLRKLSPIVEENGRTVNSIAITGGSNTNGLEVNLIGKDVELSRIGFNMTVYENNWKRLIDEFVKDFPHTNFTLSIHNMYGSKRTDQVSRDLITYVNTAYKKRIKIAALAFSEESWFKPGNKYADLVLDFPGEDIVLQAIKIYSKERGFSSFKEMLTRSSEINPKWIEIWGEDICYGMIKCKR
jgi:hypothetical protein